MPKDNRRKVQKPFNKQVANVSSQTVQHRSSQSSELVKQNSSQSSEFVIQRVSSQVSQRSGKDIELSIKDKQTQVISGNAIENRIRYLAATRSVMYGLRMSGPGIGRLTAARTGAKLTSVHDRPGITRGGVCVSHSHSGDTLQAAARCCQREVFHRNGPE